MITKEETISDIVKAIECLADIDYYSIKDIGKNAKKVHKAYEILDLLKEKLE